MLPVAALISRWQHVTVAVCCWNGTLLVRHAQQSKKIHNLICWVIKVLSSFDKPAYLRLLSFSVGDQMNVCTIVCCYVRIKFILLQNPSSRFHAWRIQMPSCKLYATTHVFKVWLLWEVWKHIATHGVHEWLQRSPPIYSLGTQKQICAWCCTRWLLTCACFHCSHLQNRVPQADHTFCVRARCNIRVTSPGFKSLRPRYPSFGDVTLVRARGNPNWPPPQWW